MGPDRLRQAALVFLASFLVHNADHARRGLAAVRHSDLAVTEILKRYGAHPGIGERKLARIVG